MKTLLLLLVISLQAYSQTDSFMYCRASMVPQSWSSKVILNLDDGHGFIGHDGRLKNDKGEFRIFESEIDALNYMGSQGWELVQVLPGTSSSWILKKRLKTR